MRISDWSSDVCSSDLIGAGRAARNLAIPLLAGQPDFEIIGARGREAHVAGAQFHAAESEAELGEQGFGARRHPLVLGRSEEHTSELQSLMRISYAVFCLKKKNTNHKTMM